MSAKPVYFPEEVMVIIKAYLLLPRQKYQARLRWWNHHAKWPYIYLREKLYWNLDYDQTPIPTLPDTRSGAMKMLYSMMATTYYDIFGENIWNYLPRHDCAIKYCEYEYEQDDLVVKLLPYRNYKDMGVGRLQEQYICKTCVEDED